MFCLKYSHLTTFPLITKFKKVGELFVLTVIYFITCPLSLFKDGKYLINIATLSPGLIIESISFVLVQPQPSSIFKTEIFASLKFLQKIVLNKLSF